MRKQIVEKIHQRLTGLFERYGIKDYGFIDLQVPPDKANGDFSLNAAMKLAKTAKCAPRQLATEVATLLEAEKDWFDRVEVAGPGFINLYISNKAIEKAFDILASAKNLINPMGAVDEVILVDYSSVNIAKQMHVGHLRSTIIGDVISRVIESLGYKVIRQNHLGDWGLPMAMVIWQAESEIAKIESSGQNLSEMLPLSRLEEMYKSATAQCKENPEVASICHEYLVRLQHGDKDLVLLWRKIVRIAMDEIYRIYNLLNVKLTRENECGESFYRDMLSETVEQIAKSGKLVEDQGALCVFLDEFIGKDGNPLPVIVRKSDGGFNYGTFDLAALRYRTAKLKAKRLIYVTDARQALHFKQVFAVALVTDILADTDAKLEHVPFGTILGDDNKPLKTRSGENVKLADLLNEAIVRAYSMVNEKNPNLSEEQKQNVAKIVGVGAVKYADLAQNRNNDYIFSFDRMLALNGNTAPYLQYAHARICSIFRRGDIDPNIFEAKVEISQSEERDLIIELMRFQQTIETVANDLRPHVLCNYLFDLASCFSSFYDRCQVLNCSNEKTRKSRLAISNMTRKTIYKGLELLGIFAPEEM